MIKFDKLCKQYGTKVAVQSLDLEVPSGQLFAFIGPNGAGKTTTVKMMVGLLRPSSGRILVDGVDIHDPEGYLKAKATMAYIPDQHFAYEKLSGYEFMKFIADLYGVAPADFKKDFEKFIDIFKMGDYIYEMVETYSLGMKQRLIISSSFVHRPKVIIVDEPLVGLDPISTRLVKNIFREEVEKNGATIFMSTHLLAIAEEIADRIGIINNGQLIATGTMDDLRKSMTSGSRLEDIFLQLTNGAAADQVE